MIARSRVDTTPSDTIAFARVLIAKLASFLRTSPTEWAHQDLIGGRDHTYCRLAVPCSLFTVLAQVFTPGMLPASFALDLIELVVQHKFDHSVEDAVDTWREFIGHIVGYAMHDPSSTILQFVKSRAAEETNLRHRAISGAAHTLAGTWTNVWECTLELVMTEEGVRWEDIVFFSSSPLMEDWGTFRDTWTALLDRAIAIARKSAVSLPEVIEKVVQGLSARRSPKYVVAYNLFSAYDSRCS